MPRILMVGGFPSLRLLYFFHLTKLGCDVISARKFSEAMRLLQIDYRFQVVFVNLDPPLEAGLAFIEYVHRVYPTIPFVITAPQTDEMHRTLAALREQGEITFQTPSTIDDLEAILEALDLVHPKSEQASEAIDSDE